MVCPNCHDPDAYVSAFSIECFWPGCYHYVGWYKDPKVTSCFTKATNPSVELARAAGWNVKDEGDGFVTVTPPV